MNNVSVNQTSYSAKATVTSEPQPQQPKAADKTASETKEDAVVQSQVRASEQVEQAVAKLNDYVQNSERKLNFQLDEASGMTIIKVYDGESEELIRQIPNEEAVSLAQKLNEQEPLLLFSAQV